MRFPNRIYGLNKHGAVRKPHHSRQFSVDLKVAGILRMPSTLYLWVYGTRRVPTTLQTSFIGVENPTNAIGAFGVDSLQQEEISLN